MRAVFLGTPEAAVPALRALERTADVVAVITQPDRPRGRSGTPQPPPVKVAAAELGLDVRQPSHSREIASLLTDLAPVEVAVIVAFGMLIRPDALAVPGAGFVNVHFSLLPRWRGAAPVQRAMMAGDVRTGVTLMRLDEGLDTGPTLVSASTAIGAPETAGDLTARLAVIGAELLARHLPDIVADRIQAVSQPIVGVTHAPKMTGQDAWLPLDADAATVRRTVMALSPRPGASAVLEGGRFKILRAGGIDRRPVSEPGALDVVEGRLWCAASDGWVECTVVQAAGKRAMSGGEWARGRGSSPGILR